MLIDGAIVAQPWSKSVPRWAVVSIAMSIATAFLNIYDKCASLQSGWVYRKCRVPSLVFHSCEALGGSIVSMIFQCVTDHRSTRRNRLVQGGIISLQVACLGTCAYVPVAQTTYVIFIFAHLHRTFSAFSRHVLRVLAHLSSGSFCICSALCI